MFDQMFASLYKTTEATFQAQQEMFKKWFGLWPGMTAFPAGPAVGAEPLKYQKKWVEIAGELIKKQRESLENQFSTGLRNIEEVFQIAQIKDAEELRTRTSQLWQKNLDCWKQACETQVRDFQAAVTKWSEFPVQTAA